VATILNIATGLRFDLGFVVGAMVAATDPVAVISTFRQLGSPRRLATLIEAESLFNDGTALVVFAVAIQVVVAGEVAPVAASLAMAVTVVVSTVIGLVVGYAVSRLIATVDDHLVELTLSLAAAYGTDLLADRTGQSGIIATVVAGLVIGNYGRRLGMSPRTSEALDTVWEFFAFLVTALVFLLIGLTISVGQLLDAVPEIIWGVVAVLIARALVVTACSAAPHESRRLRVAGAFRSAGSMCCSGPASAVLSQLPWRCRSRSTSPSGRFSRRSRSGSSCSRSSSRGRASSG
jgi:CPA1 family monovalent cation:H+ antiporter